MTGYKFQSMSDDIDFNLYPVSFPSFLSLININFLIYFIAFQAQTSLLIYSINQRKKKKKNRIYSHPTRVYQPKFYTIVTYPSHLDKLTCFNLVQSPVLYALI